MQTTYKNCQSCGMPLKRDQEHGGTEADGSRSANVLQPLLSPGTVRAARSHRRTDAAACPGQARGDSFPRIPRRLLDARNTEARTLALAAAVSAPGDSIVLPEGASDSEVRLAAKLLNGRTAALILEGVAKLLPGEREIRCEIAVPTSAAARCEEEYKVLVENAARALRSSRLGPYLADRRLRWVVVDGTGDDAVELWRES